MTITTGPAGAAQGPTNGTAGSGQVAGPLAGARPAPTAAPVQPPADPKLQAVGLALELAKVRATAAVPGDRATDVTLLLADAAEIAKYIGPNVTQTTVTLRA